MAFEISAPWPSIQTVSRLPSPRFSDSEAITAEVNPERAQDGTLYTYVKTRDGSKKLIWTFALNRAKALELRGFLLAYTSSRIKMLDHRNQQWQGFILNNPIEFDTVRRGRTPASPTDVAAEMGTVTIEFRGEKI